MKTIKVNGWWVKIVQPMRVWDNMAYQSGSIVWFKAADLFKGAGPAFF
jgi:hypothetical protein